uniref:Uncharacterized protein n=1 Tax=Tropheryma whipplei TaxID=2039 RepID=Q84DW8_TROWH|nr:unknown [Tropheryma whipplei]
MSFERPDAPGKPKIEKPDQAVPERPERYWKWRWDYPLAAPQPHDKPRRQKSPRGLHRNYTRMKRSMQVDLWGKLSLQMLLWGSCHYYSVSVTQ